MFCRRVLTTAFILACASFAGAQGDLTVTTTRVRDTGPIDPKLAEQMRLSQAPRYFLDTVDNLNRITDDESRAASGIPGLAKNNYVAKVFEVRNTEAIHIQTYLLRMLKYEGGTAEVMAADNVTDAEGKRVQHLFVVAPDFMLPNIEELVAKTDRPNFRFFDGTGKDFGGGPGAIQYTGKHRTASELVGILKGTELGNVGNFLFPPFADDSTNTIYVVDNPTDMADNVAALSAFDKPPLQLELTVTVYEVENGDGGKLGLDWDAFKRGLGGEFSYESAGSDDRFFDDDRDTFDTLLTMDARVIAEFLNFTVQSGSSRVVTSTKLTMINSEDQPGAVSGGGARGSATAEPAVIDASTLIPYTTIQSDVGATNSTNGWNEVFDPENSFEGVRITFLPFIGAESITLSTTVRVNSLIGYSKTTDRPIISKRELSSVLNIADGKTLVIGGLDKQNTTESRVGVPLLKDVPVLQYLFSKRSKSTTTSKILIVLSPKLKTEDKPEAAMVP